MRDYTITVDSSWEMAVASNLATAAFSPTPLQVPTKPPVLAATPEIVLRASVKHPMPDQPSDVDVLTTALAGAVAVTGWPQFENLIVVETGLPDCERVPVAPSGKNGDFNEM